MKFTLVMKPDGKALLVTPERIPEEQLETLKRLWSEWKSGHQDVLFVSGVDVKIVEDIELELGGSDGTEEQQGPRRQERSDRRVDQQGRRQRSRS